MKTALIVVAVASVVVGLSPEMQAQIDGAKMMLDGVGVSIESWVAPPTRSNWSVHLDTRQPAESRTLNEAVDWVWENLDGAPRAGRLSIEMAPTDAAVARLMPNDLFVLLKNEPAVFAYARHYGDRQIITMMPNALKYDWRAKAVLIHELSHVRQYRRGLRSDTECQRIAHEIRATTWEMNRHNAVGVPLTGKGLTFRQGSATLLKRYNQEFLTNNCNGR